MKIQIKVLLAVSAIFLSASSCNQKVTHKMSQSDKVEPIKNQLPQHIFDITWVHSREEDNELGGMAYRPENYKKFPISRFRGKLKLNKDGTGEYMKLARGDNHSMQAGTWIYDSEHHAIVFTQMEDRVVTYKIKQADRDLLLFEK